MISSVFLLAQDEKSITGMKKEPIKTAIAEILSNLNLPKSQIGESNFLGPENSASGMQERGLDQHIDSYGGSALDQPAGNSPETGLEWNVTDVKRRVSEFAHQGRLSTDLLAILCRNGVCAPVEFESLDYKELFDKSSYGKGKLVLRVVSFYNSYGGYLIFGVRESDPETRFDVIGINPADFDIESLKASVKEYTGERVQLSSMPMEANRSDGSLVQLLFLHIPQRPLTNPPLHFLKDGPGSDGKKKPVFLKDSVYFRHSDECVEAKGPKILELNGERKNPYLEVNGQPLSGLFRVNRISHNLPDRNFICPKFVGRDGIVNGLWRWLADDLSHIKVLAGEGGLGKTSIAYEFAERVSETPGVPFEQIVWLTAKERQFKAYDDRYVKVPERHFSSYDELLIAICWSLPFSAAEVDGATAIELKRLIKQGLSLVPSLVIIDDVDSLKTEEQRQVLELGMVIGNSASRLLLTTRFNQSFSNDNVIKLSGFHDEEFSLYLDALRERLAFPKLSNSEAEKIHQASDGSPLYSESLLRLIKWYSVNEAIQQWKGERGTAVRAAALKREVELLSVEAQRILLAVALLEEASTVELLEVLGYPSEIIERGLEELISLFLVATPALASIPRFRVPDNTRRLVVDAATTLVTDKQRLERDIENFKRKGERNPTKDSRVAAAISQAAALVRVGNIAVALTTVKEARTRLKDHFDLLSYQATLHLKESPAQVDEARRLARRAFMKGCRRPEVFECWFEAEWKAGNFIGALEAAEAALVNNAPGGQDWVIRKSASLANKASDQARSGSVASAIATMFEASATLRLATTRYQREDAGEIEDRQGKLHDQIWIWTGIGENGLGRTVVQLDALEEFWRLGDLRMTNLRRMLSAVECMAVSVERRFDVITDAQKNLCELSMSRAEGLFHHRRHRFPVDTRHRQLESSLEGLRKRLEDAILGN